MGHKMVLPERNLNSIEALFSHRRGVVQAVMPMEQKLVSEQEVVRVLLANPLPRMFSLLQKISPAY